MSSLNTINSLTQQIEELSVLSASEIRDKKNEISQLLLKAWIYIRREFKETGHYWGTRISSENDENIEAVDRLVDAAKMLVDKHWSQQELLKNLQINEDFEVWVWENELWIYQRRDDYLKVRKMHPKSYLLENWIW